MGNEDQNQQSCLTTTTTTTTPAHTEAETMIPMAAVAAITIRTEAVETTTLTGLLIVREATTTDPVTPALIHTDHRQTAPGALVSAAMITPPHPIPTVHQDEVTMTRLTRTAPRAEGTMTLLIHMALLVVTTHPAVSADPQTTIL